ncbi:MAG: alpha/beta hydrolase [Gemmatimonadales bacterium]
MFRSSLTIGAAVVAFAVVPVQAGAQLRIPQVEVHTMMSKAVGDSFEIRVALPPMMPGETTRFPVVYLTDSHGAFIISEDAMRLMMMGDVPRFIAVGIGNAGANGIFQALDIRTRDLTPVTVPGWGGIGIPVEGKLTPKVMSGGADKFLAFIRSELIPYIDGKYPTDPKDRVYFGDSLGGLFGCYVLFTAPDTFNRYIIGSPSLWWGGESTFKLAEDYAKTHKDLAATVFLGVGGLEELPPAAASRMVTNTLRLERELRAKKYPSLELSSRVFPDESHTTVAPMNLIRGLVAVFGAPAEGLMERLAASRP